MTEGERREARGPAPDVRDVAVLARGIFAPGGALTVARVPEGVSTYVYRVVRGAEVFYLRVLPEVGKTFAPEVSAHTILRGHGARVPEVVHYESSTPPFGLSVMVTTAIAGRALAQGGIGATTPAIVAAAGRDLALVNSVPVAGFGWVERDAATISELSAELADNRGFLIGQLEQDLATLPERVIDRGEVAAIGMLVARHEGWLDVPEATLAHGDFDPTHIYEEAGCYAGIIDFGEIRGTDRWYDLAHFALRDGERFAVPLLPWLLDGYREVMPLPTDATERITFAALLIGVRLLARSVERRGVDQLDKSALRAIRSGLAALA